MKKFIPFVVFACSFLGAEEEPAAAPENNDVLKISEALGHLMGKQLDSIGFKFDIAQVIKGLQDAKQGKGSPMTEMECIQAITAVQETIFKKEAGENLKKADEFFTQNSSKEGVVTLEPGKLQYKIEKAGTGAAVQEHDSPLIRYTGKFLDGSIFDTSKEDEMISLDETIPGFTKGLIGMKEGEKRTLFIHPELGYGTKGYLPPNSLLTFEVEIVKATAPRAETADSLSSSHPKVNPEIALPGEEPKVIR